MLNAAGICKKILRRDPRDIDAIMLLADISYRRQDYEKAVGFLRKAINLAPDTGELYCNLGLLFQVQGKLEEAIDSFKKAIQLNPSLPQAYYNLSIALKENGNLDESVVSYKKAIGLDPDFIDAYLNLGEILKEKKQLDEAMHCFRNALQIEPGNITAIMGLAGIFLEKRHFDRAEDYYREALLIDADNADIYFNLGLLYTEKLELDGALTCLQKAGQFSANNPNIYYRLGVVQFLQGRLGTAAESYKRALSLKNDHIEAHQSLMMLMNYSRAFSPGDVLAAHLNFARKFEQPLLSHVSLHTANRINGKRLHIGYVSPDFRKHSVAYFIEPVLTEHHREEFEVFCYSNVRSPDRTTSRIQSSVEHWRDIHDMSDEDAVELIRRDEIDILIDLAGHTTGDRMLVFVRRPAPVQISWIGYPATTGLKSMDYKVVDGYTDPPGMTEQWYTEKLARLPDSFLCYQPKAESPDVSPLPALTKGHITFGSFNNFAKVSRDSIEMWTGILRLVPESHIVLKSHCFSDEGTRRRAMEMFTREGIGEERVELLLFDPSVRTHLSIYGRVDIALDTFPYNGTTTTCEALWMGVPVITLAGDVHASRVGTSLLTNVGLAGLISGTKEEYVDIAVSLANDIPKLESLHEQLREMVMQSPLTDARRFTRNLEQCYLNIWEQWCKENETGAAIP